MSLGITYAVALFMVAVELLAILHLIRLRSTRRFVLQTAAMAQPEARGMPDHFVGHGTNDTA